MTPEEKREQEADEIINRLKKTRKEIDNDELQFALHEVLIRMAKSIQEEVDNDMVEVIKNLAKGSK